MKKIKNELGEEVIAIGNLTSPVRMLQKYPIKPQAGEKLHKRTQ